MVVSDINLANTMGGKTARACDNCISKRARWYCPADDAFLCQGCDSSVHSANPLALRHERVLLKTAASMKHPRKLSVPSWHHGFTKKARTRRYKKHAKPMAMYKEAAAAASSGVNVNPLDLVPEICSDDNNSNEENDDEQVLYRVPILDPLCINDTNSNELMGRQNYSCITDSNQLHGSLPSEMELEEFAADVENLLGKGLDDESFDIEGLGFSNCIDHTGNNHDDHQIEYSCGSGQMKVEEGKQMPDHHAVRDPFLLSFDFDSSSIAFEDDHKNVQFGGENCKTEEGGLKTMFSEKKILLRLDYEGVLTAWSDQRSPWATGERPELDPNDCWPVCMGSCGRVHSYGHPGGSTNDGGREARVARVSRYREKRRTRLFTKKIRYEVRKLNAEKRPRMKGRFVKRANFSAFHSHDN